MYHNLIECEIIVVDNNPSNRASATLRKQVNEWHKKGNAGARYIEATDKIGAAYTRNVGFAEAEGEFVLALDCHVLLSMHAIGRLLKYYTINRETTSLLTGPLLPSSLNPKKISTHFDDVWRGGSHGIWGRAFQDLDGRNFSVIEDNEKAKFIALESGEALEGYPDLPFKNHENALDRQGYRRLGILPSDDFVIPAQGLWLFSCRKDAWIPFPESFSGVGGSDKFLHAKFRQAGRESRCLGFLSGVHRFERQCVSKIPNTILDQTRNLVLGHNDLGLPLDRMKEHLVPKYVDQKNWDLIVSDPVGYSPRLQSIPRPSPVAPRKIGPGSHLKMILEEMGIESKPNCSCRGLMTLMDQRGVAWVKRPEKKAFLLSEMRDNLENYGWSERLRAGIIAAWNNLPLSLEGLFDEAIRRCEA